MTALPSYLTYTPHADPGAGNVSVCGSVRFTFITERLVRMEEGIFQDAATQVVICRDMGRSQIHQCKKDGKWVLETPYLRVEIPLDGTLKDVEIRSLTTPGFIWRYGMQPLHNLMGTTTTLDEVNGACALDPGILSRDGYAVMDDSSSVLMTEDGWFRPRSGGTDLYFFGYGWDYEAAVRDYYRLTGVPDQLPAWALGNWWSRYHAYSDTEYLTLMDKFEAHDVPLSVGIVDMDWHLTDGDGRDYSKDGWTGYTWNEKLFPDYKGFLHEIHNRGLRTALNLHPAYGVRHWDRQYEEMAVAMGIDPSTGEKVPFNCLDPRFLKAYFEILHFPYEKDGVDFWWMDWQQGTDYQKVVGKRYEKSDIESITPLWMLNHMHYLASCRDGKRGMIFSRYSGYGAQRYPIGFSGDSYITWESLAFQPYFTATASNIGYGWWSHDIGGHMGGYRDDELTVRWIQLGVFSPIFRLHSTDSVFLGREPWNYNKRAELIISDFMRLRHRLFPYLYAMNRRNHKDLIPMVRPMYHLYPSCAEAYEVKTQYAFGSEMLVSPIVEKADAGALGRAETWLPKGRWIDAFTGYVYRGNQKLSVYRPMETMPVFLKEGAIVPLQAHEKASRKLGGSKNLEILVAPGADNVFTLYEDDGETLAYKDGKFAETEIRLNWGDTSAELMVCPAKGELSLIPETRNYRLILRGFAKGTSFYRHGDVQAQYHDETNSYTLTLSDIDTRYGFLLEMKNDHGLIHDNSDAYDRVIDAITRAQNTQQEKVALGRMLDQSMAQIERGETLRPAQRRGSDTLASLGGYMYELLSQLEKPAK